MILFALTATVIAATGWILLFFQSASRGEDIARIEELGAI